MRQRFSVQQRFSGLWLPIVTPFLNKKVNHAALTRLVKHYASTGLVGLVVCGTTGEAPALSEAEQLAVLATVQASLTHYAPSMRVVMGVSGYKLDDTCAWAKQLATLAHPPEALLVSAPHYIRPSQSGLRSWFEAIADSAACPVIIYDIPYRTSSTLDIDTLLSLAEHPMIQGIKDCGGNFAKTQSLIADGRLAVLAGEDANIFATLAAGGSGAIAASLHVATSRTVRIAELVAQGDIDTAQTLWEPLLPVFQALFEEPNPGPIKAVLTAKGLLANELRLPMTPASSELTERLIALLEELDGFGGVQTKISHL